MRFIAPGALAARSHSRTIVWMSPRLKPISWSLPIQRMRIERVRAVEAEAALGAGGRRQQAELLVEVDGADRLAGFPSEITDLHQIPAFAGVVERTHAAALSIRRDSAGLRFAVRHVDALQQGEAVMIGHSQTLT